MFTAEITAELKYYVYRLIDPRNGETFYVGKGKGNRVFDHAVANLPRAYEESNAKIKRIREIQLAGFEVQHVIHRHGMEEQTAFEVEGALMDAYQGTSNIAGGHNNTDRGVAHSKEIIERYQAEEAVLEDAIIEVLISRSALDKTHYDATRFAWKVSFERAKKAKFAIAVVNGLIVAVFEIERWLPATPENFPNFELLEGDIGRFGFEGKEATPAIQNKYLRKKVPLRAKGAANPIRYFNI